MDNMKQKLMTIWVMAIMVAMIFMPLMSMEAEGDTSDIYESIPTLDGGIWEYSNNYADALAGGPPAAESVGTTESTTFIGSRFSGGFYSIYRSFFSFNTTVIQKSERVVSAEMTFKLFAKIIIIDSDFEVELWGSDYGNSLDAGDWNTPGILEAGINTTELTNGEWFSYNIDGSSINKTGLTQYQLNSSTDGTPPTAVQRITVYTADSLYAPYLTIQTVTETEAIITYNFTVNNDIPEIMNITTQYYDAHDMPFTEDWENNSYIHKNWSVTGTPVIGNAWIPPYEGSFCAGGMVNISGTGTHEFTQEISMGHFKWVNIDYARTTVDAGAGTPELRVDWWDGIGWNTIEDITGTNAWAVTSTNLSLLGADYNKFFKLRFQISFQFPQNAGNEAWVDYIFINATHDYVVGEWDSFIHPAEISDFNASHELLRYEIFLDNDYNFLNLSVNASMVYSTHEPNMDFVTSTDGTYDYFNASHTEIQNYDNTHLRIWFFKSKLGSTIYEEQMNIYPVEIINWGAQDLVRYEFESLNATHLIFDAPNTTFTHLSITPQATVTQYCNTTWNITDLYENAHYKIWFTINKTTYCDAFITLTRESEGIGIPFNTWNIFINEGSETNTTNMETVNDPAIKLKIGMIYTLSAYDYFPDSNFINNYTFIAFNTSMDVTFPIPYGPLNFKSFRTDTSAFRIWYESNTSNNPYQNHVPGGEWFPFIVRGGEYMVAIDYLVTSTNGSSDISSTYFLNFTINSSVAYTINIGIDLITVIETTVDGIDITLETVKTWVMPSIIVNKYEMPVFPIDPSRGGTPVTTDGTILVHPYMNIEADVYSNVSGITSYSLWDPTPSLGTSEIVRDFLEVNAIFNTQIMLNYTNGTNIVNYSNVPTAIDLKELGASNITFWSNSTSNIRRITTIRSTILFIWTYEPNIEHYFTTETINNTTPFDWYDVYWKLSFVEFTVSDRVTVFDNDNKDFLIVGDNYEIKDNIRLRWDRFNSSLSRTFTFSYFNASEFDFDEPEIRITEYDIVNLNNDPSLPYWRGTGTWDNSYSAPYSGRVFIVLNNLDNGIINPDSVILEDADGNVITSSERTVAGNLIMVASSSVGTIPVDGELGYTIYFQFYDMDPADVPALYSHWQYWLAVILFLVIMVVGLLYEKEKDKRIWIVFWIIIIFMWAIIGIMSWYLHLG